VPTTYGGPRPSECCHGCACRNKYSLSLSLMTVCGRADQSGLRREVLKNAILIFESHLRKRSSLAPSPALAEHAVDVELVSTPKFPFIRENNREFRRSDRSSPACWRQISQHSQALRPKFPVKIESGIHGQEPGHSGKLTGESPRKTGKRCHGVPGMRAG